MPSTSFKLADAVIENDEGTIPISSFSIVGCWHRSWFVLVEWRDFELLWRDYGAITRIAPPDVARFERQGSEHLR